MKQGRNRASHQIHRNGCDLSPFVLPVAAGSTGLHGGTNLQCHCFQTSQLPSTINLRHSAAEFWSPHTNLHILQTWCALPCSQNANSQCIPHGWRHVWAPAVPARFTCSPPSRNFVCASALTAPALFAYTLRATISVVLLEEIPTTWPWPYQPTHISSLTMSYLKLITVCLSAIIIVEVFL